MTVEIHQRIRRVRHVPLEASGPTTTGSGSGCTVMSRQYLWSPLRPRLASWAMKTNPSTVWPVSCVPAGSSPCQRPFLAPQVQSTITRTLVGVRLALQVRHIT
jgi:hypothetical protein